MMEFHISRRAREKYQFDQTLFAYDGNIIFANFHAARIFAQKMNAQRDLLSFPEQTIKAGQLNAMGLIDEIFHYIFHLFDEQKAPGVMGNALGLLEKSLGKVRMNDLLQFFVEEFPPSPLFTRTISISDYLKGKTKGVDNRELVLEELILFWLTTRNPALESFAELFTSKILMENSAFADFTMEITRYFDFQPPFGPQNQTLLQMLLAPSIEVPDSITGQLEYIREHWSSLLGDYLYRLLSSLDLIKEENILSFTGAGPIPIPVYDAAEFIRAGGAGIEAEAFSKDREWMPRLVLIAKNSYVWLDQLSRKYKTEITRLDQIPDIELEVLARRGITGLWLIGLWERSPASAQIKRLCGNPEAISSAYSLYSYQIAADLGGEGAYQNLRDRSSRYGIRLASDMVPNHMGIDSEWVIHQPERFLSLDECPFPSYSFNGQNLSTHPNVSIQIEDHYFDKTDAAVVFKRQDNHNGQVKYIYHGNDGTSMPWNDTAQLNYLNPEVREAVIQTILDVARKFPIIRFDAAMTLAKKHYQRLWFPQPGTGGAIPSRAEHGFTQEDFNRLMPVEFWREVVDRAAVEAPDTLLLAEAFWLMEGYFVRTLGMHRVYNSAFMHMLRNEDNAGYRKLIKNTLEFEPEILKRYVNFMNNPDERTAVDQFGKGDKYFGICMLMATLPGLPMLGHGQIEGFAEKYGMEFHKANWHEEVDQQLVERHEWEIFPLLHQRQLFAGVENFWFYDFNTSGTGVNENVYAFSNHHQDKSAFVIYNNAFPETEGWVNTSVEQSRKSNRGKMTSHTTLIKALSLPAEREVFIIFKDQVTGLSFLRPVKEMVESGLRFSLRGYEHHAFVDFRMVKPDADHDYHRLYSFLGENGVPDIEQALNELFLRPVLQPFNELVNEGYINYLVNKYVNNAMYLDKLDSRQLTEKITNFLNGIKQTTHITFDTQLLVQELQQSIEAIFTLPNLMEAVHLVSSKKVLEVQTAIRDKTESDRSVWYTLFTWAVVNQIGKITGVKDFNNQSISWLDEWQLSKPLANILKTSGCTDDVIQSQQLSLRLSILQGNWYEENKSETTQTILRNWLSTPEIQNYLHINRFNDILWYNRETFGDLLWWMMVIPILKTMGSQSVNVSAVSETIISIQSIVSSLKKIEKKSAFQVEKLISLAGKMK